MATDHVRGRIQIFRRIRVITFWLAVAFLAIGVPLLLTLLAIAREPREWHWNDWINQLTQILASVIFFGLAWFLGRETEIRSKVVANAELITSMGVLSTSSARAYAGNDAQALRIAADARAALQHYPHAEHREQYRLTEKVIDAYSDLTFGTFTRADGLPRSIWNALQDGASDVMFDAENLAKSASSRHSAQRDELRIMTEHIRFAIAIGREVRSPGESFQADIAPGSPRRLDRLWRRVDDEYSPSRERIAQLAILYRRELTVVRDWSLLQARADCVHCSAALHDIRDTDDWLAPWYVKRVDTRLEPVNVRGNRLGAEVARFDHIPDVAQLPVHPKPLRHVEVPPSMREEAIAHHYRIIEETGTMTICVLTYGVMCDDGRERRVVLDGNHRLAAARRLAQAKIMGRLNAPSVRVLEFSIVEKERLTDATSIPEEFPGWKWQGFTPDVETVRSAWVPSRGLSDHRSRLPD